jgi:2-haloacid dehalogenase
VKLRDFSTLTFDCYGTLIDWESGIIEGLGPLLDRADGVDRDHALQAHAFHESEQQALTPTRPYREVLAGVYRRLAEEWAVDASWDDCLAYGNSVERWPAFPDSAEALGYLREHYRLMILSNVDNASFTASNRKLGVTFDAIYTAEDIGSFKPNPANFAYLTSRLQRLGVAKAEILHTAESLFHDHVPAQDHGLASCWIHRRHEVSGFGATRDPGAVPEVAFRFTSMAELADAHRAEN